MVNEVRSLISKTVTKSSETLAQLKRWKQAVEMDWSDKKQGIELDVYSAQLATDPNASIYHAGAAAMPIQYVNIISLPLVAPPWVVASNPCYAIY